MGQKTVSFSDLSGEIITTDDSVARIVVHEHPELGDGPVEIEALLDEARAIEKAALRVAVVDLYLPGDLPHRVTMDLGSFDEMATDKPMSELLVAARPARRGSRAAARPRRAATAPTTRTLPTRASPTKARSRTRRSSSCRRTSTRSTHG